MHIRTRTALLSVVLSALLIPALGAARAAQATADEVIEKYITAVGGRAALSKITSRRATGTVSVSTPAGDLTGPIEVLSKAPNKSRAYITLDLTPMGVADKMVIEQKFDGVAGWSINSMQGDQPITGAQLENMKSNSFPTPLLNYKTTGFTVEMAPREQVSGKSMIVLKLTPKGGSPIFMYFDPDTNLVARTKTTLSTPEMGDLEQISDQTDYRVVDGVKTPFKLINTNAAQTVTITLTKVEHNVPIDDAVFSKK